MAPGLSEFIRRIPQVLEAEWEWFADSNAEVQQQSSNLELNQPELKHTNGAAYLEGRPRLIFTDGGRGPQRPVRRLERLFPVSTLEELEGWRSAGGG